MDQSFSVSEFAGPQPERYKNTFTWMGSEMNILIGWTSCLYILISRGLVLFKDVLLPVDVLILLYYR